VPASDTAQRSGSGPADDAPNSPAAGVLVSRGGGAKGEVVTIAAVATAMPPFNEGTEKAKAD
jgi:hypothetical protein